MFGSNVVGSALVKLLLDDAQFQAGLTKSQIRLQKWGGGMSSLGSRLTRSLSLPLAAVGGAMIKLASDAEETQNKVREVFGKSADAIFAWSKGAIDSMGLAQQTAQDMGAEFGLLFEASKLPGPAVVDLSKKFVQLAGDMASFFNVDTQTAMDALRSGLVGETEPLRRFGVLLSDARLKAEAAKLGIAKLGDELTEQQKVQARAAIITGDLAKATGDFARTSDSAANQARKVREEFKEIGAKLGKELLPFFKDLASAVSDLADWFSKLSPEAKELGLKLGAAAIVAGPFLRLLGGLLSTAGRLVGVFHRLKGAAGAAATAAGGAVAGASAAAGGTGAAAGAGAGAGLVARGLGVAAGAYMLGTIPTAPVTDLQAVHKLLNLVGAALQAGTISADEWNQANQRVNDTYGDSISKATKTALALEELGIETDGANVHILKTAKSLRTYADVMTTAEDVTDKQRASIAKAIGAIDLMGGALRPLEKQQVKNLLAVGDFNGAMEILAGRLDKTSDKHDKARASADKQAEAMLQAEQKAKGLAAQLDAFPNNVRVKFQALGLDAIQNSAAALREQLDYLDSRPFTIDVILNSTAAVRERAATGGIIRSPMTLVGERGPEMVSLPYGSKVHTAQATRMMGPGGVTINATFNIGDIDSKETADRFAEKVERALTRATDRWGRS